VCLNVYIVGVVYTNNAVITVNSFDYIRHSRPLYYLA
jgi:hypothetical protein